jgi:hypothetical protein
VKLGPKTLHRLKYDARDPSMNIHDEKINYLTALRLLQPNLGVETNEWVITMKNNN